MCKARTSVKASYRKHVDKLNIIHWNIEGLLSKSHGNKLDDDLFASVSDGYDVIALTETHLGPDPDIHLPGYFSWHKARAKHNRAKIYSGGISLFIKQELKHHVTCLPSDSSDILWIRIHSNHNQNHACNNLTLGVVYISPANSSYTINNAATGPGYQTTWEILQCELEKYKADSNICLIGDFNSHTGTLDDFIRNDDDKFTDVPTWYNEDIDSKPRANQDIKVNDYGKKLVQLCQMSELRIANGRKLGDSHGNMTCHKYNGSSTVDYFIADSMLLNQVLTFRVEKFLESLSDHCPISACINMRLLHNTNQSDDKPKTFDLAPTKKKWDPYEELFKIRLTSPKSAEAIKEILASPYMMLVTLRYTLIR